MHLFNNFSLYNHKIENFLYTDVTIKLYILFCSILSTNHSKKNNFIFQGYNLDGLKG